MSKADFGSREEATQLLKNYINRYQHFKDWLDTTLAARKEFARIHNIKLKGPWDTTVIDMMREERRYGYIPIDWDKKEEKYWQLQKQKKGYKQFCDICGKEEDHLWTICLKLKLEAMKFYALENDFFNLAKDIAKFEGQIEE